MEDDQEFEDLKKRLQPFPNYFQLELQTVSCKTWKQVKQKLEEEEEAHVCQSDMEIRMDKNLKACVYYELGDPEKAGELLVEVLNSSRNKNINASAMMALIHYKNGMFTESNNIMGQLEALKDSGDTFPIEEAYAEMAYGYSRIDARYYTKAIKLFEYVIKRQPVQHEQFVFTWKFGLALTLRRCIRFDLRTLHPNIDPKETDERADDLLVDIIKNCRNDGYIAMACVERADLCSHDVDPSTNIDKQLVERLIEQGVNKAPNDHVILAKAGKLLRRIFKLRKAEIYLRKSVNIRETPLGLHQLGLLLKGKLKKRQKGKHIKSGARVRGTGHTPRHTQESISDCRSMPRKREGFTIGNEYDKGSSKPVLGNSSNNPIPESKSILSTVYKDRKLNSQPIMKIGPELAGVTLESKKANDTISRDQLLNNTLDCTRPTNMARKSIDVPLTVDKTQPDGTRLTAVVGGEHKTTLKTKCVFNTKCDTEKASDMTDTFDSLVVKVPGIVRSSSLSPYAKPFVPSRKQPVACDTQIPPTTEYGSSMELYGSPMWLFNRILKSPAHNHVAIYNKTNTHQLEECIAMFQKSYDISQGRNCSAAYDIGLTYLQMTPPQYEKARDAFRKTFDSNFPLNRYKGFEQSGICLVHMSQKSYSKPNDYLKDAFDMFKKAIRCWGLCLENMPSLDNQRQHIHSLKSVRQLILGGEEHMGIKEVKEVADLHYCVRLYGESLGLYKELKTELERSNDAQDQDLDIAKGIIKNNVKLRNFSDVLDLILILVNSREGFESKAFILEVLLEIIKCAISNENDDLIESVFDIYRRLTEKDGDDDDIVVIYHEETVGGQIFGWLQKLSGLKITKNDDHVPINRFRKTGQIELISNCDAVIFIITDQGKETAYCEYLVASALEAMHDKDRHLSKIIPITVNNCSLPSSLGAFKSLPYPRDNLNTDITSWLSSFCDILLSP